MEFQVLGDVAASHRGRPVELGRRQERCLLGLLLLEPGRVLLTERLIELLWSDVDAADRRATLHTYVARLRRRLAPYGVRIVTRGAGYLIDVDPATVDLHRFTAEVARTRTIADPAVRAQALAAALDLWRGPLLAGVADEALRQRLGRGLEERRLAAFERRVEAELAAGEHVRVVGLLADLVREFPTREHGIELFMVALSRSGRRTEALEAYRDARRTLVEEFGVEPGQDLQRLHQRILADDPELAFPTPSADNTVAAPRHLPRDIPGFIGRDADLVALDNAVSDGGAPSGVAPICTIGGIGGLGKTALAVHWAHRAAARYPDGQVFVNLRGHGTDSPTRPIDALGQLLRALSVPPERIPLDVDEAAALYRSTLADRRVLVLLDNAVSSEQVRPLLPASANCLTVITSRNRLDGLVAHEGAQSLRLGLLSDDEAYRLVATMIGADRAAAGRDEILRLAALCGNLPLALRVAAARIVVDERLTVPDLLLELADARERLSGLAVEGDSAVRGVFAVSYRALPAASARVFRLLGLVPNTVLSTAAVAVLAGQAESEIQENIDALVDRYLLDDDGTGRYQMHDLLRLYGAERAEREDSEHERLLAVGRLADAYVQQGVAAQSVFQRLRTSVPMRIAHPLPQAPTFDSMGAASSWFQVEGGNLVALVRICDSLGLARETWQLADCQYSFLVRTHALTTLRETHELGVVAARLDDRPDGERLMANGLGVAYALGRDFDQAIRWMEIAAQVNLEQSSPRDEVVSRMNIGNAYGQKGDWDESEKHLRLALAAARQLDDVFILCVCLSNLGWLYTEQGRAQESLALLEEALRIAVENDIRQQIPPLEVHLAHQNANLARHESTVRHARAAVALRHLGDQLSTARGLYWLGVGLDGLGATGEAVDSWREALALMTDIGSGDAEYPAAALARVDHHAQTDPA
ncbi:AfsR/SARP family transcriptional regulator [Micromonospora sp. CA-269861]|uniref:AfsR/SARP family transcriptional regulator n=1 Tax=Micromonospora sp. CA-269861 TaxID=3239968 RepID=UPI003D8D19AA